MKGPRWPEARRAWVAISGLQATIAGIAISPRADMADFLKRWRRVSDMILPPICLLIAQAARFAQRGTKAEAYWPAKPWASLSCAFFHARASGRDISVFHPEVLTRSGGVVGEYA